MVVAYDLGQRRGYYRWHSDLFSELSWPATHVVSLTIPTNNELVPSAWEDIRQALLWHHRNLLDALRDARDAKSVLPTIHRLAATARQLLSIDRQPIPELERTHQQEGLLALLEMIQHQEVVKAVSRLASELVADSVGAERLRLWINEYRAGVTSVFPRFAQLPEDNEIPSDFEVVYARNLLQVVRPRLLQAVLELIILLTSTTDR